MLALTDGLHQGVHRLSGGEGAEADTGDRQPCLPETLGEGVFDDAPDDVVSDEQRPRSERFQVTSQLLDDVAALDVAGRCCQHMLDDGAHIHSSSRSVRYPVRFMTLCTFLRNQSMSHVKKRSIPLSESFFPPVWQVGQYWKLEPL